MRTTRRHRSLSRPGDPPRRPGLRPAVAVAAATAGALLGCTGEAAGPADGSAASPAALTSPAAPTADPDHLAALEAYESYVWASNEAANLGEPDLPALAEFADGPALLQARSAIRDHAEAGRVYQGSRFISAAEVAHFDLAAADGEPHAVVEACLDISEYVLVHVEDGSPVAVDRGLEEFMVTASLFRTPDERWMVISVESHRDMPCRLH